MSNTPTKTAIAEFFKYEACSICLAFQDEGPPPGRAAVAADSTETRVENTIISLINSADYDEGLTLSEADARKLVELCVSIAHSNEDPGRKEIQRRAVELAENLT